MSKLTIDSSVFNYFWKRFSTEAKKRGLRYRLFAISKREAFDLFTAYMETKGGRWVLLHFLNYLINISCRRQRNATYELEHPPCETNTLSCRYRDTISYNNNLNIQKNNLRVEAITFDKVICRARLRLDRIGGRDDDYLCCIK